MLNENKGTSMTGEKIAPPAPAGGVTDLINMVCKVTALPVTLGGGDSHLLCSPSAVLTLTISAIEPSLSREILSMGKKVGVVRDSTL